jgi:hypothetical protein
MVVQTGIKWEDVNNMLAEKNIPLFFPVRLNHHYLCCYNANDLAAGSGSWSDYRGHDLHRLLRK